jgi:hypothetical protein
VAFSVSSFFGFSHPFLVMLVDLSVYISTVTLTGALLKVATSPMTQELLLSKQGLVRLECILNLRFGITRDPDFVLREFGIDMACDIKDLRD